jgi:hypothetical protein
MAQQILTSDEVLARVGFSKTTRDRMEAAGQFPKRIAISPRRRDGLPRRSTRSSRRAGWPRASRPRARPLTQA